MAEASEQVRHTASRSALLLTRTLLLLFCTRLLLHQQGELRHLPLQRWVACFAAPSGCAAASACCDMGASLSPAVPCCSHACTIGGCCLRMRDSYLPCALLPATPLHLELSATARTQDGWERGRGRQSPNRPFISRLLCAFGPTQFG